MLDGNGVQDSDAIDWVGVPDRASIEPHDITTGRPNVSEPGGRRRCCTERNGLVERGPRRGVAAKIDGVGPHKVMQFFEFEGEVGADFVRLRLGLQFWLTVKIGGEFDDEAPTIVVGRARASGPGSAGATPRGKRCGSMPARCIDRAGAAPCESGLCVERCWASDSVAAVASADASSGSPPSSSGTSS